MLLLQSLYKVLAAKAKGKLWRDVVEAVDRLEQLGSRKPRKIGESMFRKHVKAYKTKTAVCVI
jgi:hypothetical protein